MPQEDDNGTIVSKTKSDTKLVEKQAEVISEPHMTASQFADIKAFSNLDKKVVKHMHGIKMKPMSKWHDELKNDFKYEI